MTLNVVSGCAGIGGTDLGFRRVGGYKTVCYIEWEDYPTSVLLERMRSGELDSAPIFKDFTKFDGHPWRGLVDVFIAGIPCQPHSLAGKRAGKEDKRNLWPDMARITREMEPRVVVVENVEGLYSGKSPYGYEVSTDLHSLGYVVVIAYVSAAQTGAPHERMRTFTMGFKYSDSCGDGCCEHYESEELHSEESEQRSLASSVRSMVPNADQQRCNDGEYHREERHFQNSEERCITEGESERDGRKHRTGTIRPVLPNTESEGLQERRIPERSEQTHPSSGKRGWWKIEPSVGRVVDELPHRMDRIKCLGNAVVPAVAEEIGIFIKEVIE